MKRALAVAVVTGLLLAGQAMGPASACGCGGAAPEPGSEVSVDREVAVVRWDGDREQIVMRLDMSSDSGTMGLVVPTPSPATVTAGDTALFDALDAATAPIVTTEYDWWGPGPGYGADGAPGGGAPTVLDSVQLGPLEAVTLAAADTAGLQSWLGENGFELSDALLAELGPYVDEGWSFVALRITSGAPLDGELDPITFTFDSQELVYPIRMSRAATTPQSVRLYVLDDHRATVELPTAQTYWAGPVDDPDLTALGAYLTVVDISYPDPASDIEGDILVERAADDVAAPILTTQTERVEVLGLPAGIAIIGGLLLLVLLGGVTALAIRSSRRANT